MITPVVLITDIDLPGTDADDALSAAGLEVHRSISAASAVLRAEVAALMVQWEPITASIMDSMPKLRFISRLGIGCDMIDLAAASERGIAVANTPTYCVEEVASHTMAMILCMSRGLMHYDRSVRGGSWRPVTTPPRAGRPSSMTVSVVGFGRIGSLVAAGCASLGFRVLVADPYVSPETVATSGYEPVSREAALARADVLTLHAPLLPETRHMINDASLATMKPGSMLVNTCRGGLVDEAALARALSTGHLAGVALDVFEAEPLPYNSVLRDLDNVVLTPHASWYSPESLIDLPRHAAANIVDFFAGRPVTSIVNA